MDLIQLSPCREIPLQTTLIVALSGGADSVCLTHLLWKTQRYNLILAYFNHQLRGAESQSEEKLVRLFAQKLKLPLMVEKWQKPSAKETQAREARYAFLRKIQKEHQAQWIVLAHHQDDQIETILFNFIRGCELSGLSGMHEFQNGLWRPLLNFPKQVLLDYCHKYQLNFCTDSSNFETKYRRNFLRHKVLPLLKEINPNLNQTWQQNTYNYTQIEKFLDQQIENLKTKDTIALPEFLALDLCLQNRLIKIKIQNFTEPSYKKIAEILKIIHGRKGNKFKQFGKIKVSIETGKVIFQEI